MWTFFIPKIPKPTKYSTGATRPTRLCALRCGKEKSNDRQGGIPRIRGEKRAEVADVPFACGGVPCGRTDMLRRTGGGRRHQRPFPRYVRRRRRKLDYRCNDILRFVLYRDRRVRQTRSFRRRRFDHPHHRICQFRRIARARIQPRGRVLRHMRQNVRDSGTFKRVRRSGGDNRRRDFAFRMARGAEVGE